MDTEKVDGAPSPADWTTRLEAALQLRRSSGPAAALSSLQRLTQEAPDRAAGWIELAACLRDLQQPERAEAVLVEWLQNAPSDGRALHDLARLHERRGAWADAEVLWRRLLAAPDHVWWIPTNLATALQKQGRSADAEEILRRALARHPTEAGLFCDYARLAEKTGDWTGAIIRWEAAQAQFPMQSVPRLGLAGALRHEGDVAGAERVLRVAAEAHPHDYRTQHDLARILEQRGDWAGAEEVWSRLRAFDEAPWHTHSALATVRLRLGRLEDAEEAFEFGLTLPTRKLPLFAEYAQFAEQRADWGHAAERWQRVREQFPDLAIGYLRQSGALRKIDHVQDASAVITEARQRFATDPEVLSESAAVKLQQGDWEGAASDLEEVTRRNPNDAVAAHRLYEARRFLSSSMPGSDGALGHPTREADRSASARSLGHRVMAAGPLGGDVIPMKQLTWAAQHYALRTKNNPEFSPPRTLAATFIDATEGRHDNARRRIVDTIDVNEHLYPHDLNSFNDLLVSAIASCSWEAAVRMLQDRYGTDWCADVRVAADPIRPECVRWTVLEDGRSKFEFDPGYFDGSSPLWLERWAECVDLFFRYSMFPEKQSGSVIFSVSDHGLLPGLAFSDFRDDVFLVPDAHFIDSRGYVEQRAHYDSDNVPWHQRKPVALWRGSAMRLTGPDLKPISGAPLEAHRIKLCVIARDPNTARFLDAGLTANFNFSTIEYAEFENAGLTANRVNYRDFTKYRYQIDIDGISNAWAALFWKLLTGSAVLKVESPAGFKQWYYGDLKPWVHYVPVAADLSDLVDRIRWLQAHDDQAREIGRNGRALAQAMTYDSALDSAMPTIGAAFRYFGD